MMHVCGALLILLMGQAWAQDPFNVLDSRGADLAVSNGVATVLHYDAARPPELRLSADVRGCRLNRRPCPPAPIQLRLPKGMPSVKSARLTLELSTRQGPRRAIIWLLPKDFPWFELRGQSRLPRPIIFSTMSETSPTPSCDLLRLGSDGSVELFSRPGVPCMDFRPHRYQGKTYYSYQKIIAADKVLGLFGPRVILNDTLEELERATQNLDGHEFHWLGPGHWLGIEASVDRLPNGAAFLNRFIRERVHGRIVFEWGVRDFERHVGTAAAPQSMLTSFQGEVVLNYIHMNTVQILPDDALLVGLGHNGVAYLEKNTRRVRWILGGLSDQFSLEFKDHPFFNHGATYDPTTQRLWLLSNYLPHLIEDNHSRILRYDLDLNQRRTRSVSVLHQYDNVSILMGGLEVFGDVISLSTGHQLRHHGPDLSERSAAGEHFSLRFSDPGPVVYRFYRPSEIQ